MPKISIRFAPINVPLHRRRQTFAVVLWVSLLFLSVFIFFLLCLRPSWWPFVFVYLVYIFYDTAPEHGGRRLQIIRSLPIWSWFAQYFPASLIVSHPLNPERNYVFGYHPHGIISIGAFANFATEANDVSRKLPGLNIRLLTLASNFTLPLYRDLLLSLNICSVSRKSCERILKMGPGNSLMIVIGGAAESLNAHPFTNDLTLKKRMGFIKVAIRSGADLVPVFSFGENDIFEQVHNPAGSNLRALQKQFQSVFGFTTPLFHGRGIFNYNFGILPHRRPIVTVVGKPVHVEQCDNPPEDMVKRYHELYVQGLFDIWEKYKDEYAPNRIRELRLAE